MKQLMTEVKREMEAGYSLNQDNAECKKLRAFLEWFGDVPALQLRYYSQDQRGIHAAKDIKVGERILFVPQRKILMDSKAIQTEIGKIIADKNLKEKLGDKATLMELVYLL